MGADRLERQLTASEIEAETGVPKRRIRGAWGSGELERNRIGHWSRSPRSAVARWIRRQTEGGDPELARLYTSLALVRARIEEAVAIGGGASGVVLPIHRPLSSALDVIAAALQSDHVE